MEVKNLRDLDKIILLCRKRGVKNVEISGIRLELSGEIPKSKYLKNKESKDLPEIKSQYTDMEALLWSSSPHIPDLAEGAI